MRGLLSVKCFHAWDIRIVRGVGAMLSIYYLQSIHGSILFKVIKGDEIIRNEAGCNLQ